MAAFRVRARRTNDERRRWIETNETRAMPRRWWRCRRRRRGRDRRVVGPSLVGSFWGFPSVCVAGAGEEIDERGRTIGSHEGEERRWNECDGMIVDERRDRGEGKGAIETRRARLDDDDMTTDFTRFRFSLCVAQYHQYQVVGRHVPTEANPEPEVFRMKLWALDAVKARSKFWYVDSPR